MDGRPRPIHMLSIVLALVIASAGTIAGPTAGIAAGQGSKADFSTFVGSHLDDLADCVDTDDPPACVRGVGGTEIIIGFGFFIGAILKFKAHKGNPTLDVAALESCLTGGATADSCLDEASVTIGGPSMPGLANGILAHYVLRDACPCGDRPDAWPNEWSWAY